MHHGHILKYLFHQAIAFKLLHDVRQEVCHGLRKKHRVSEVLQHGGLNDYRKKEGIINPFFPSRALIPCSWPYCKAA